MWVPEGTAIFSFTHNLHLSLPSSFTNNVILMHNEFCITPYINVKKLEALPPPCKHVKVLISIICLASFLKKE